MATDTHGGPAITESRAWAFLAAVFWTVVDGIPRFVGATLALMALLWVFLPGAQPRVIAIVGAVLALTAVVGGGIVHTAVVAIVARTTEG